MRAWRIGALLVMAGEAAAATPLPPGPPLPPVRPRPAMLAEPSPPLPPVRPPEANRVPAYPREAFGPPMPPLPTIAATAPPATPGAVPLEDELACVRLLNGRKVEARVVSPPPPIVTGCTMPAPVELSAVLLADGRRVGLQPPVTIGCPFGAAFADWVREDLASAFETAGKPLAALIGTSGYACRGRNNVPGAKLSEHARGDAIDVGGFKSSDGSVIGVKQAGAPLLPVVKATACARFATVLGPGSDGFHEQHMHIDGEPRRHGAKLCQWTMP